MIQTDPACALCWVVYAADVLACRPMWGRELAEGQKDAVTFCDSKEIVLENKDEGKTTKKVFEFDHGVLRRRAFPT